MRCSTNIELSGGRLWIMPVGAEPLDVEGKQLWYATEDGTGSVVGHSILEGTLHVNFDAEHTK